MMSAEIKVYLASLSSFIVGLLISHGVADPSQANALVAPINTIFGDLIDLGSAFYVLETLLVKHKAEVADKHFLLDVPEPPVTPVTPSDTPAPTDTVVPAV